MPTVQSFRSLSSPDALRFADAFGKLAQERYLRPNDPRFASKGSLPDENWEREALLAFCGGIGGILWVLSEEGKLRAAALTWTIPGNALPEEPIVFFAKEDPSWSRYCDQDQELEVSGKLYAAMTAASSDEGRDNLCVEAMIVAEPGKGDASALLQDIVDFARSEGLESVYGEIQIRAGDESIRNEPSIALFERNGFEEEEVDEEGKAECDNTSEPYDSSDPSTAVTWRRWVLTLSDDADDTESEVEAEIDDPASADA